MVVAVIVDIGGSTSGYSRTVLNDWAATVMSLPPGFVKDYARPWMRGYVKDWGRRGNVKECGTYTIIDCREWQKEQWDNERWQRGAEARRREREQSVEERREWCRRRTCRRRMLAEYVDAPGPLRLAELRQRMARHSRTTVRRHVSWPRCI